MENNEENKGKNDESLHSGNETFFLDEGVGKSGSDTIKTRFETLIEHNREKPFDWYKELGLDKSDASKIRRGLIIPPEWLRIKIANHFKTDSSTLWKVHEIVSANGINQKENKICESCKESFKPNPKIKNEILCRKCIKKSNSLFDMMENKEEKENG